MKHALTLAALASCITGVTNAASPPPQVPENLQACSKQQDASERVRCYDAQIAAMNAAAATNAASAIAVAPSAPSSNSSAQPAPRNAPTVATVATRQQSPEAKFGQEFLPASARPRQTEQDVDLASRITGLSRVGPMTYHISLSNGQIWRQEGSHTTTFFRVGDDVRIKKGMLGSYQMSTSAAGSKNWVRVTRVQ